jgi:hypothetical protein
MTLPLRGRLVFASAAARGSTDSTFSNEIASPEQMFGVIVFDGARQAF